MKALLNEEGKKIWGYAFPDGSIQVTSPVASLMQLGDSEMEAYIVAWDELSPVQRGLIIKHLAEKFVSSEQQVEKAILEKGLPIRASLVECVAIPTRSF